MSGTNAAMDLEQITAYTTLTAELLGIELDDEEIGPVAGQVARVAALVERMERIEDDASTPAPRFVAGSSSADQR